MDPRKVTKELKYNVIMETITHSYNTTTENVTDSPIEMFIWWDEKENDLIDDIFCSGYEKHNAFVF